jgi:hypothetical protein
MISPDRHHVLGAFRGTLAAALEEQLWAGLEADIGAFWETYEAANTSKDGV